MDELLDWKTDNQATAQFIDRSTECKSFLITDTFRSPGSFMIHRMITKHLMTPDWQVTLICTNESMAHYMAVQRKLGGRLDKGSMDCIDLFGNTSVEWRQVYMRMMDLVGSQKQDGKKLCVVVDDLSVLLYVGMSIANLVSLVNALIDLTFEVYLNVLTFYLN